MGYGYGNVTRHDDIARDRKTGERVASTFSNSMTAHVWAQRTQTFGKSSNGNIYFQGDALYSYGSHFLAGYLLDIGKPEPVALTNADSRSVTTSGHVGDARGATRHLAGYSLPGLTDLSAALPVLARYPGKPAAFRRAARQSDNYGREARALRDVRKWLGSFTIRYPVEVTSRGGDCTWTDTGNSAGAYLIAGAAGIGGKEIAAIQNRRQRDIAKAQAQSAKRKYELQCRDAKRIAALSDADFKESWPPDDNRQWTSGDGRKPWDLQQSLDLATRLNRAAKVAKRKGWTRIAAQVRMKEKALREHIKGRNQRIRQVWRDELAQEVRAWRNGKCRIPSSYGQFENFPAIKRAIERAQRLERAEQSARVFAQWKAGELKDGIPALSNYEPDSAEWREVAGAIRAARADYIAAATIWLADESASTESVPVLAHIYRYADLPDDTDYRAMEARLTDEKSKRANREEWERQRERRAAWLAGERNGWHGTDELGGALMRIAGDQLETSQGASVPLDHAIKAFRSIKLCRDKGRAWQRNSQTIRVGHFQVDSIEPSGDFKAGCHRFTWSEVERIARVAGVFEGESV